MSRKFSRLNHHQHITSSYQATKYTNTTLQFNVIHTNSTIINMFSKTFIATLLASSAAATPIVSARAASDAFGLISIRSGTDLQNQAIVANGGRLYIGKETSSYCPLATGCPGKS